MNEFHPANVLPPDGIGVGSIFELFMQKDGLRAPPRTVLEDALSHTRQSLLSPDRSFFTQYASWMLPTQEWVEWMTKEFAGKCVLEFGAGTGFVGALMRAQGVEWISTDLAPAPHRPWADENPVKVREWDVALQEFTPDVLFFSWWPHGEVTSSDLKIARWAANHRKKLIFVGEGDGGCTGSHDFWEHVQCRELMPYEDDVVSWPRIGDSTFEMTSIRNVRRN